MDTIKKIMTAFLLSYSLFACDKPGDETKPIHVKDPSRGVTGQFELTYLEGPGTSNEEQFEIEASLYGEGELNILGASVMRLTHSMIIRKIDEQVSIENGILTIYGENNTELRGTYSGVEELESGNYLISVKIEGSTGNLAKAYGSLSIELTPGADEILDEHTVKVTGVIYIGEADQFPLLI